MPPRSVQFLYSGIRVRDMRRSLAFYRAMGFRVRGKGTMAHGGRWAHLVFPGSPHRIELNFYPRENPFYEPFQRGTEFDHFGFYAPDVADWARRATRAGGTIVADFVDRRQRLIYVADPDGIWLEAFGPVRSPSRSRRRPRSR